MDSGILMIQDSILVCSPDPRIPHTAGGHGTLRKVIDYGGLCVPLFSGRSGMERSIVGITVRCLPWLPGIAPLKRYCCLVPAVFKSVPVFDLYEEEVDILYLWSCTGRHIKSFRSIPEVINELSHSKQAELHVPERHLARVEVLRGETIHSKIVA
jgi:hypothetical protein